MVEMLGRDSFFVPEVEIFKGVCAWCQANENSGDVVMKYVRWSLMSLNELLCVVRPAGLVPPDVLLDAIDERTTARICHLPHRGQLGKCYENLFKLCFWFATNY